MPSKSRPYFSPPVLGGGEEEVEEGGEVGDGYGGVVVDIGGGEVDGGSTQQVVNQYCHIC